MMSRMMGPTGIMGAMKIDSPYRISGRDLHEQNTSIPVGPTGPQGPPISLNKEEDQYLQLLREIIQNGDERIDRTKVGVKSIFGVQARFNLMDGRVPCLTTKKMAIKACIEELLFFIRGSTNTILLEEKGVNVWKGNTSREFLDSRGLLHLPEGEMGKGYGHCWRNFGGNGPIRGVDQLANVIKSIKEDPYGRRHIVSAWNPLELDTVALPPCHCFFQFYVSKGKLSLQWYQRSVDIFLGFSFNLLSYAILLRLIAQTTNLLPGELIFSGGDVHLYTNHIRQAVEQMVRTPLPFPKVNVKKSVSSITDIENLEFKDFEFFNYQHHPAIKAEMAI